MTAYRDISQTQYINIKTRHMKALTENKKDVARELARKYNVRLSIESLNRFTDLLQPVKFRHKTFILEAGNTSNNLMYLVKGLVRQYRPSADFDKVEDIVHEGDILTCVDSLFTHEPSQLNVQTLEPTVAYSMNYQYFKELAGEDADLGTLLFSIIESIIIKKEKIYHLLDSTPIERYMALLHDDSEIIRRTPLKYVASYLRMAPETLSRVRNAINKRESSNT